MTNDSNDGLTRWRRRTDTPLLCLALIFLVVFLLPLYDPSLSPGVRQGLLAVNIAIWVAFAVDYAVRLHLVANRWAFVRGHVPDLLMIVVPVLRPLRVLRVIGALGTAARRAGERRVAGTTAYVLGAVALLLVIGAGLALDAERSADGANITSTRDALWWALATVTTVGYGDRFPVTDEGRVIATGVMLCGIALLGVVTAAIAAWFIERVQDTAATDATLNDVLAELREMRAQLTVLTGAEAGPGGRSGPPRA
jgi:voltage-gated potassium channel